MANVDVHVTSNSYLEADFNNCVCTDQANARGSVIVAPVFLPADAGNPFGVDIDCVIDTAPTLNLAAGLKNVGNALARRYSTPRGSLFYDLTYGYDLRALLNAGLTTQQMSAVPGEMEAEALKDERIQGATVSVDFDLANQNMTATVRIELATGTFDFIFVVSKMTVDLLEARAVS